MGVFDKIRTWPAWFALPSLLVAAAIGATVSGYAPLLFDPSLYPSQSALAAELSGVDADALEKSKSSASAASGAAAATGKLQDGEWTGYAVCGQGNAEGWKPYYVSVTIEVKDAKVASITDISGSSSGGEGASELSWDPSENQKYLDLAISGHGGDGVQAQMETQISAQGSVASVDAVSGATYSSTAIYNAYADAVARAGGSASGAGGAVQAPASDSSASDGEGGHVATAAADASAAYADGDWTGYAACGQANDDGWNPYYVAVTVNVSGGKPTGITKIEGSASGESGSQQLSWDASENQKYLDWAIGGRDGGAGVQSQVNTQLSTTGSVSGVDTVSGATYSSEAIVEAYGAALKKAAAAAGSSAASDDVAASSSKSSSDKSSGSKSGSSSSKSPVKVDVEEETSEIESASFADGTWTGYYACGPDPDRDWNSYYVAVTVKVEDGKAASVVEVKGSATGDAGDAKLSWDASENQRYLDWAISGRTKAGVTYRGVVAQIEEALSADSSLGNIDAVSGATYSSAAIVKAYYAALKKSAAAAGATYEEPVDESGSGDSGTSDGGSSGGPEDQGDSSTGGDAAADGGSGSSTDDQDDQGDQGDDQGDGTGDDGGDSGDGTGDQGGDSDGDTGGEEGGDSGDGTGEGTSTEPVVEQFTGNALCEDPTYEDDWDPYYVLVTIEAQDGVVTKIVSAKGDDEYAVSPLYCYETYNATYFNQAMKAMMSRMQAKIDAGEDASDVDTVSGATFSSRAIIDAYVNALSLMS